MLKDSQLVFSNNFIFKNVIKFDLPLKLIKLISFNSTASNEESLDGDWRGREIKQCTIIGELFGKKSDKSHAIKTLNRMIRTNYCQH